MDALTAAQPDLTAAQSAAGAPQFVPGPGSAGAASQIAQRPPETSAILKLKGLPYSATEDDIRGFFSPYELKTVSFVYEPDGRPSGLAFAEFVSKDEALKALSKNGEYIGQRYVRLLHVPRAEMEEQVRLGTLAIPGAAAKLRSRMIRTQQRNNMAYMAAGPVQLMPTPVMQGRPVLAMGPPGPGGAAGLTYAQPPGPGQGPVESRIWPPAYQQPYQQAQVAAQAQQPGPGQAGQYQSPAQLAAQFSSLSIGGPQQGGLPRGAQVALGPQGLGGQPAGAAAALHMPPPPAGAVQGQFLGGSRVVQAASSPTVKIRGLPYRSSPSEILAFFQNYHYLPDTLQIGLDQLSRPSGEAWLSFASPQEALRAVRDLNRHYLGNRYLELSIC